ncbi:pyridoxal phosphate-dependent aminotransferase [Sporobolomyces salmoneus]|uniref:pyridoxal phosphate-dependent aminotransferase n=1 Tax=Sporobolomyces salmoneus TaxID=183962 RepID=UPI00316CB126
MSKQGRRHESSSEAHQLFRSRAGHRHHSQGKEPHVVPGVVPPGSTGVLYVTERATSNGFKASSQEWANFGQGAPETGALEGAAPRLKLINLEELSAEGGCDVNEYAPASGVPELREAVAKMYNELYRKGKESQYTSKNVCIVPGGRAGLTRVTAVLGDVLVNYTVPEYTCYDQILGTFKRIVPLPSILHEEDAYHLSPAKLEQQIRDLGLTALMLSNPHNPTGQVIHGKELESLVEISKEHGTTLILDEFYDQYIYEKGIEQVSAAEFIEDVNIDNVILINGLTKGFRLPGWRCCWIVGPEDLITAVAQSGGFLDGGSSHILQRAALPLLEPERVRNDRKALQSHFLKKRDHVLSRLRAMGFDIKNPPNSTFYIWLDLRQLPEPISSGMVFFEECLKERVIVVPGQFFDVNPSNRRNLLDSPCDKFVRLSFGPPLEELDRGLNSIERVVKRVREAEKAGKDLFELFGKDLKQ